MLTSSKSLVLSQPKSGQGEVGPTVVTLPSTTVTREDATEVKVEIPGVDPSTVQVEFEGHTLRIRCEKGELTLPLNPNTDTSKITADILWGMLTLTIPLPAPPAIGSIKVSIHDVAKAAPSKSRVKHEDKFTEEG